MEALVRWNSSTLGSISPGIFIPIAESTGLIVPIGEWVLRTACAQAKAWHDEGFPLNLAVNLSGRQLHHKSLSERVRKILDETGYDPSLLNLEVTESAIVDNPVAATEVLAKFQKLGISISIDDFGTGHSSFSYLRSLPIDVLKIDKSFIDNITVSDDAATLVKTMITMAHDLRFSVVAEGVETADQLETLQLLGCDQWQGFLHSKPLPANDFRDSLNVK
jgi:EAL domain-containing protein (putative c-di-GMP-specific phosphodiesterase class I)